MHSILRDDPHRAADAARASGLRLSFKAGLDQPNIENVADDYASADDAPFLLVVVDTAGARFSVEGPDGRRNEMATYRRGRTKPG